MCVRMCQCHIILKSHTKTIHGITALHMYITLPCVKYKKNTKNIYIHFSLSLSLPDSFIVVVVDVGTQKHWWNFKQFERKRFVCGSLFLALFYCSFDIFFYYCVTANLYLPYFCSPQHLAGEISVRPKHIIRSQANHFGMIGNNEWGMGNISGICWWM